ncbi:hypothetical protein AVEN_224105-1 [Araneus ventricosus]|uniref:Uncharacterized protein n=1 Tax=Araneus ventricosus TaxID=182803 RepID=A0A4Y2DWY1_ARAVE|nr:hypothetical protein AVEN_224105-1 [Araneus ventricosus]
MKKSFSFITINFLTNLKTVAITGTRSCYCFVPVCFTPVLVSESNLKCFFTSQAMEYKIHSTTKAVEITLQIRDSIAYVYDGQWWLVEVNDIIDVNKDVLLAFYPVVLTAFKKRRKTRFGCL